MLLTNTGVDMSEASERDPCQPLSAKRFARYSHSDLLVNAKVLSSFCTELGMAEADGALVINPFLTIRKQTLTLLDNRPSWHVIRGRKADYRAGIESCRPLPLTSHQ